MSFIFSSCYYLFWASCFTNKFLLFNTPNMFPLFHKFVCFYHKRGNIIETMKASYSKYTCEITLNELICFKFHTYNELQIIHTVRVYTLQLLIINGGFFFFFKLECNYYYYQTLRNEFTIKLLFIIDNVNFDLIM